MCLGAYKSKPGAVDEAVTRPTATPEPDMNPSIVIGTGWRDCPQAESTPSYTQINVEALGRQWVN